MMDDMKAFERQLAARLEHKAGPRRPVDAMAIASSVTTEAAAGRWALVTRRLRGSVPAFSSVARFVAATVIVALFGGFLLVGILAEPETGEFTPAAVTPSPSPVTVDGLLAGMVTSEDPEHGVIRVENDGHRDIYRESGMWGEGDIEVGADGSVWIIWPEGRFFRLGQEVMYDLDQFYDAEHGYYDIDGFEAGPDGTLWATSGDDIVSFDSELDEWTPLETDGTLVHDMAIGVDGTAWLMTDDGLVRIDADGSTLHPWPQANDHAEDWGSLQVSDDGVVWLTWAADREWGTIVRFDGDEWHFEPLPSPVQPYVEARVSPEGTLWIAGDEEIVHRSLARFDGSEWTVFDERDGVGSWGGKQGFVPQESISASLGGSVLVDASDGEDFPAECSGMARFDGTAWTELPSPVCVVDADTGPDGSVWVLGPPGTLDDGLRLTVIRPDAAEFAD